jgi:hypothetical protein
MNYCFLERIKRIIDGSTSRAISILAWLPIIPAANTALPFTAFLTAPPGIAAINALAARAVT